MKRENVLIDEYVAAAQSTEEKEYWLNKLAGEPVKGSFYYDFKPQNVGIRNFKKEEFRFTGEMYEKFLRLSGDSDIRLHMILTAGLVILIEKYTGEKDIMVGTPVYKEEDEAKFVNTVLVLRNIVETGKTFKEILVQVRQTIIEAVDHVNYPVEVLAEQLGKPVTHPGDFPLFDIVILLENIQDKKYIGHIGYNIAISITRKEEVIEGILEYNAHRYRPETIERIVNHFMSIFRQVLFDVEIKIHRVEILSEEEKRKLLNEFNHTRVPYPREKTLDELFEEQAGRTPGEIAVSSPIESGDIFTATACFKKNPYIFKSAPLESTRGTFTVLKTNTHHSAAVNKNMLELLDGFTGKNNLGSLFSMIKESKNAKFVIYTSQNRDMLGITHDFTREARVFLNMEYDEFIALVQLLYKSSLIRYHGVQATAAGTGKIEPPRYEAGERYEEPTVLKDIIEYNGTGMVKTDVLLLGDTHGMPTTGLLYLASYLRRNGVKALCRFYDGTDDYRSMEAELEKLLERTRPQVVGISMKWFLYIARVMEMCEIIKNYSRRHGLEIKVVVGGNTASYYWEEIIKNDSIDYLVRGDGEEPLLKIFRGEKPIPNCIYRENGEIIENPITYIQDETNSAGIYLSHLEEILLSGSISLFGTFFVYTQKGCAMNCLYCGGSNQAQQKTFNRKFVLRRGVEEARKDITAIKKYVSALHFEFDNPDKNLADYCRKIWEGIDLTGHFCYIGTITLPSVQLVELVSRTFKYVYWDFDICTPSERHRKELESLGWVRPQPADAEIMEFMATCEKYKNIEVRPNLITGLPYFTLADLEPGEKLLTRIMSTFSCSGQWHWARLHAQPGAPILENVDRLQMHSYATTYRDFLKYSRENFNRDTGYVSVENFNYPYIYYKDELLNSRITNFYLEVDKKTNRYKSDKTGDPLFSETLTYGELEERARRLAVGLRARGVKPDDMVGLKLERSRAMIVGILGTLKAGGGYLPVDPETPGERVRYILKDSAAKLLVTTENIDHLMDRADMSNASGMSDISNMSNMSYMSYEIEKIPATSLAYVIYTSGTTGKPKGVMVGHRNVVNLLEGLKERIYSAYSGNLRVALVAPFVFDASVKQIFGALLQGHGLYIVPGADRLDSDRLRRFFLNNKIDITDVTPAHLYMLSESENPAPGRPGNSAPHPGHFIVGGDVLSPRLVERFYNGYAGDRRPKITNIYGPTECTVDSTSYDVPADHLELFTHLPIGKPLANHYIYILNARGCMQPIGVPGELCIAGEGVARGYLNRPELTAEKFCLRRPGGSFRENRPLDPDKSFLLNHLPLTTHHSPIYKTGDQARWLPGGEIEFLGRSDTQVKIRGNRIELGEIENRLNKHPQVEEAVVVVKEVSKPGETGEKGEDGRHICAYIVPRGENSPAAEAAEGITGVKKITAAALARCMDQVKTKGEEIAVKAAGRAITYGGLEDAANRLAGRIQAEYDDRYKLSKRERERYTRQMLIHGWGSAFQEKLKATTVFVAGAGGGASPTIMQLASMGIGTIKICDYDKVELSNLNRQFLHDVERIGMNKAQSARVILGRINPEVKVIPIEERLTRENVFELVGDAGIIFDMMDGPADKFTLSRCAVVKQVPHVIIAMADLNGYATVLHTPHTPCYHCLFSKEKLDAITAGMKNYVENYKKNPLAVVPAPLLIGSGTVVNEVIKILMGEDEPAYNKFFYYNQRGANRNLKFSPSFKAMTHLFSEHFRQISRDQGFDWEEGWRGNLLEVLEIRPDPRCPMCGDRGKELRKELEEKNKKAVVVENREEKDEAAREADRLKTVGLMLPPGIEMAAAIMAAVKAGKTFVPIDPATREQGLLEILEDSEARIILTDEHYLETAQKIRDRCNRNIKIIKIDTLNESHPTREKAEPAKENLEDQENLENLEMRSPSAAYLLYPPGPRGNTGYNTAAAGLFEALVEAAEPYTISTTGDNLHTGSASLPERLRDYLMKELPAYMIPSYIIGLEKMPHTPNGKVNREALPGPREGEEEQAAPPRNQLENRLVEIWAQVLRKEKDKIGIDANFFQLGGHSLTAAIMVSRVHKELKIKLPLSQVFSTPTVRGLTQNLTGENPPGQDRYKAIEPAEKKEYYPLSIAQQRIFLSQQLDLASTLYNIHDVVSLGRDIQKEKLEDAFKKIIARHEALRTSFRIIDGKVVQRVSEVEKIDFDMENEEEILGGPGTNTMEKIMERFVRPFDLGRAPLIRAALVKTADQSYVLLYDLHHTITDLTSGNILIAEFMSVDQETPPLKLHYKDFSEWQNSREQQERIRRQEEYWLKLFSGGIPTLDIPLDFERPPEQSFQGDGVAAVLNESESRALKEMARQGDATVHMVSLALISILLSKLTGREDIIIGVPNEGRRHVDLERIIGVFINTQLTRSFPQRQKSWPEFLGEVKQQVLEAYENQDCQFEELLDKISVKRDIGRNSLVDVALNYLNQSRKAGRKSPGGEDNGYEFKKGTTTFDLVFTVIDYGEQIRLYVIYNSRLYRGETVGRYIAYIKEIIKTLDQKPGIRLKEIAITHELVEGKTVSNEEDYTGFDF